MSDRGPAVSRRFRFRLLAWAALIVVLLGGAWTWSLYGPLTDAVTAQEEQYLLGIARAASVTVRATPEQLQEAVTALAEGTSYRITVVGDDGTVLADSAEDPAGLENHGDRPEVAAALSGRTGTDVRYSETQGVDRMYVAVPTTVAGDAVAVRASTSLAHVATLASAARRSGMLLLLLALALSFGAIWRFASTAAAPVEELADAARRMAAGELGVAVPSDDAALAPLAEALASLGQQMRDRIGALEQERQSLRLVLDGLADGVLLLEGDRIITANRALVTLFRAPPVDVRGRPLHSIGLPAPIVAAVQEALGTDTATATEVGPDPYRRSHRVLVLPLGTTEAGRRTLVVITDITERTRLDAMRRDFVANASHELKTPTAGIVLLASSAEQAARDGDNDQAARFVSQISAEADRLRRMVADLLDLSRLESVPDEGAITDVRRAVDLALAGHRRAAAERGLDLAADVSAIEGQDMAARCDATDLAIALDNLLANAVTYTEAGSVTVRVTADAAQVVIAVSDTGIGIPPKDVERVFERFYRVDRARSRESGGTGLGLALVRNAAERWGGSVSIESPPGKGTTVTIRLPRAV